MACVEYTISLFFKTLLMISYLPVIGMDPLMSMTITFPCEPLVAIDVMRDDSSFDVTRIIGVNAVITTDGGLVFVRRGVLGVLVNELSEA